MVYQRSRPDSHLVTRGNKIIYRGVEIEDIVRTEGNLVYVHIGQNTYKKFKMSTFRTWIKIKQIRFKMSLDVYDEGGDDEWYPIYTRGFRFTPIEFLSYITKYNHAVPFLNDLSAVNVCDLSHYRFNKIKIYFYDGTKKSMRLNKFIAKYFDDNVF